MSTNVPVEIVGIIQKKGTKAVRCFDISYQTYFTTETNLSSDESIIIACKLITETKILYFFVDLISFNLNYRHEIVTWDNLRDRIAEHVYEPSFSDVLVYTSVPGIQYFRTITNGVSRVYKVRTSFTTNMTERPLVYGLNYTNKVTAEYTNINYPSMRNKKNRRKSSPDLVFTKLKGQDIDLANTIVSVNGIVGLPIYNSNRKELFVKNGAYMLADAHYTDQNITLLDFSKLFPNNSSVKLLTYKLSDCAPDLFFEMKEDGSSPVTLTSITGSTTSNGYTRASLKSTLETFIDRGINFYRQAWIVVSFSIPIEANNYEKIPILCIGGRLFFPNVDDLTYTTVLGEEQKRMKIEFKVSLDTLEKILAANLQHTGVFFGLTSSYRLSIGYIISNMFTDKEYNYKFSSDEWKAITYATKLDIPFVSLIQTDKYVSIENVFPIGNTKENALRFIKSAKGILTNGKTREIVDYTSEQDDGDLVSLITPQNPLFISELEGIVNHISSDGALRTEIPDATRYGRLAWEHEPEVYTDAYNKISPGELLKDINSFFMVNILCASKDPIKLFDKAEKELPDETGHPVYTAEYEMFKFPIRTKGKHVPYVVSEPDKKITVSAEQNYTLVDNVRIYDASINGLDESLDKYNQIYEFDGDKKWIHEFDDGPATLEYDQNIHVWKLTHGSIVIIQSSETNQTVPYRANIEWGFESGE